MQHFNDSLVGATGPQGYCGRYYGTFSNVRDCIGAIQKMDQGTHPIRYTVNQGEGRYALPFFRESGKCLVQIEAAGPNLPTEIEFAPSTFRTMADWVLENCLNNKGGSPGGWYTTDLRNLRQYITKEGVDLSNITEYPKSTGFLVVTLSNPVPEWLSPGNWDQEIAFSLSETALSASRNAPEGSALQIDLVARAKRFHNQGLNMEPRGLRRYWWDQPPDWISILTRPTKPKNNTAGSTSTSATARRRRRMA